MYVVSDLGEQIMREIDASSRILAVKSLNLNPPGGYIGQIPQSHVAFDAVELADATIPTSGLSLLINLNRIRAGAALGDGIIVERHLSSGLIIPTEAQVTVQGSDGVPSYEGLNTLRFPYSYITLLDAETAEINLRDVILSGIATTGSGFITRSWFVEGALVSGTRNADHMFYLPYGAATIKVVSVSPSPGDEDTAITILQSADGETWNTVYTYIHPADTVYYTEDFIQTIASGNLIGFEIGSVPSGVPFTDLHIILETYELGPGGESELPDFTPKRVPFADNTTGQLTEDSKFNFVTRDNSSVLVIGADDYSAPGYATEKVALDVVRDGVDGGLILETYHTGSYAPAVVGMRARGTRAAPAGLLTGDIIFRFTGRGYSPSGWSVSPSFSLKGVANEDWGEMSYGTKAVISITKDGEYTATDMMTLTGTGMTVLGFITGTQATFESIVLTSGAAADKVLTAIDSDGNTEWRDPTGGANAFIDLTDVPTSYSGYGGYGVKVKADETGLEFGQVAASGVGQTKYDPDISSGTSDYDDEFITDLDLDKWTLSFETYDSNFDLSQTAGGSVHMDTSTRVGYLMFQGDIGANNGIEQSFYPAHDSWTLICKVNAGVRYSAGAYFCFGINGSDQNHNYQIRVGYNTVMGIRTAFCDDGSEVVYNEVAFPVQGEVYLMLTSHVVTGTTYYSVLVSKDGIEWIPIDIDVASTSLTRALVSRLYFGSAEVTLDGIHSVDFVRYFEDSAYHHNIGSNP